MMPGSFQEESLCMLSLTISAREIRKGIPCREKMATVRVFIVSVELSSTTERASGTAENIETAGNRFRAKVRIKTDLTLLSRYRPELREHGPNRLTAESLENSIIVDRTHAAGSV